MEAYKQLLNEFHSQQISILQQDSLIQYTQLLNHVKRNKEENSIIRKKHGFQSKRLKTTNQYSFNNFYHQKQQSISKLNYLNETLQQRKNLIQLQRQSLLQQVDNLKSGLQSLKQQKNMIQDEITIIDKKEIQISNALFESQKNNEEIKILIKQQHQKNQEQFHEFNIKIKELTEQLEKLNNANVLNSKIYKQSKQTKKQTQNNCLLGTILMWQKQKSKIKQMPKKNYTKSQIQSILRALFLIVKFSELNYGNIIQHLIKMNEERTQKVKSYKKIYLDNQGEEIQVKNLIQKLEKQILLSSETKFLSKTKIIEFYQTRGVAISSDPQTGTLSKQTNFMIKRIIHHFQKLTSWFSRIENRNRQLSESFKSLTKVDEQLSNKIKEIVNSVAQKSINYLQSRQQQIEDITQKVSASCKIIFQFNINTYDLAKRFQNINKFFDKIVKSTSRKTYKRTFVEFQQDTAFLRNITKILCKSPQCIILDWSNVIKDSLCTHTHRKSILISKLSKSSEGQVYFQQIMRNDLLRIYAKPSMYNTTKSSIQNIERTFNSVIKEEKQIIVKISKILKDLLLFSKNGINEFQNHKIFLQEQRKVSALLRGKENKQADQLKDQQTKEKLNPLLKILQLSNAKFDTFFVRDEIKENDIKDLQPQFCIQSNDYYRRDNFKLIQKIQKLDLKKRGIINSLPMAVNTSLELQPLQTTFDGMSFDKQNMRSGSTRNTYRNRQPRLSHQLLSSRHNELSERRQMQSLRKKDLKNLLKNISSIASENQKYRIRKKLNSQQRDYSTLTPKCY